MMSVEIHEWGPWYSCFASLASFSPAQLPGMGGRSGVGRGAGGAGCEPDFMGRVEGRRAFEPPMGDSGGRRERGRRLYEGHAGMTEAAAMLIGMLVELI